jgi:hypothetical protein
VEIVCTHCWQRGRSDPEIMIEEDDTLARCTTCGRRYGLFTGDLARTAEGRPVSAIASSYVLYLAPSERLPQRRRVTAPTDSVFERGYRYTLVWHQGRLVGIADQTTGRWTPVTHAWSDDVTWRAAWLGVTVLVALNLMLQLRALRGFLQAGTIYWLGPVLVGVVLAILAARWLLTEERD